MAGNRFSSGGPPPGADSYRGGGDPYAAPPGFGPAPSGVTPQSCPGKQSVFEGALYDIIPFSEWSTARIVNRKYSVRGRSLSFGIFGNTQVGGAALQSPIAVVTFKQFEENQFVGYSTNLSVPPSAVVIQMPPSDMIMQTQGIVTYDFEEDFEQFFLTIDPGVPNAPIIAGDFIVIVKSCPATAKFQGFS